MEQEELRFEGCNFFRQRLAYSLLSGRSVVVSGIRSSDDEPGIKGTEVGFSPGMITGGKVTLDCGNDRCISYYLEPLLMLAPFCKHPLNVKLQGITDAPGELSVDSIRATWLPVFNKFMLASDSPEIKIVARGYKPDGGGCVLLTVPIARTLRPVQCKTMGKICKIRGIASVSKVSPSIAHRMIEASKETLRNYIADVYITVDQRKGAAGGNSPGFGLFLTAETTEGVIYHGEAVSKPKGEQGNPLIPEDIGYMAACQLLDQIFAGGCVDITAQALAVTFMTLCQKDVSTYLFGPPSAYCVHTLRNLKKFFEITFKMDNWNKVCGDNETCHGQKLGSDEKVLITCIDVNEQVDTSGLQASEWEWLKQLCELADEECYSKVNNSFQNVALILRLDASSYVLELRRTKSFPVTGPEVVSSLGTAFKYSWQKGGTLRSLYNRFSEHCLRVDLAIKLCSDVRYPFTFVKWTISEDDSTCIAVTLFCEEWHARKSFELFLLVDWLEPNAFPRVITSSAPEYLENLRLDEWDSSREMTLEKSGNETVSVGHLDEAESIIFTNGPMSDNDFTNEFHSLPCRIEYDGPAKVSQYFVTETLEDEKIATFRGRILNGIEQQFPNGYRLYITTEKEKKGNSRVFEVSGSATSFMRWEYDRSTSYQSPITRAISYLNIAETFARDDE
uniref:RNA 3'-terminal phosphate cyclase-like protein n=1 Tax=Setaria digitata TaxID=48799 RepID=A0A915PYV2_9BILA